ncbi:hypothetical protein PAHAL_8G071700 [Panicum hallii]|jgi:hypothetical protein|uniref:Uncharacterized protein n=1 Tax=Panicum hallii TaxID=206008 RepID=A0A2S3IDF1_9POAL|nr:hypothetical protein PAHAL_8G071700 [Panicum hallii]
MKKIRLGDIASLFRKLEAKKNDAEAAAPAPNTEVVPFLAQEQEGSGIPSSPAATVPPEDISPGLPPSSPPPPPPPPPIFDLDRLSQDPVDRFPIVSYSFEGSLYFAINMALMFLQ